MESAITWGQITKLHITLSPSFLFRGKISTVTDEYLESFSQFKFKYEINIQNSKIVKMLYFFLFGTQVCLVNYGLGSLSFVVKHLFLFIKLSLKGQRHNSHVLHYSPLSPFACVLCLMSPLETQSFLSRLPGRYWRMRQLCYKRLFLP